MSELAQVAHPPDVWRGAPPLRDAEFDLLRTLVHREAGIFLAESKKLLLAGRLSRRLRTLGLHSYLQYYRLALADREERVQLLDAVTTNETHFFREPRQFEFLEREVFPRWAAEVAAGLRPRRIRAWSAGCSTGEEPYSLAMVLLRSFPAAAGWHAEVLATDLSTRVLAKAQAAVWSGAKAREIPPPLLREFMLRGVRSQEGSIAASPALRAAVTFARVNLNEDRLAVSGPFDLILCRNVLIYFRHDRRRAVVERLLQQLAPDGYLLLGHAESLAAMADCVRSVGPIVYTRVGGDGTAPAGRRRES